MITSNFTLKGNFNRNIFTPVDLYNYSISSRLVSRDLDNILFVG